MRLMPVEVCSSVNLPPVPAASKTGKHNVRLFIFFSSSFLDLTEQKSITDPP